MIQARTDILIHLTGFSNSLHIHRDSVTAFSFFISLSKEIPGLDSVDVAARIQSTISVFAASYFRRALRRWHGD
jgi:hypothetical protein